MFAEDFIDISDSQRYPEKFYLIIYELDVQGFVLKTSGLLAHFLLQKQCKNYQT